MKNGGILLANDSHGDATLAYFDKDFEFIGVVERNKIMTSNLDSYFKMKDNKTIDLSLVRDKMKGLKYINMPSNYIFRKIKSKILS